MGMFKGIKKLFNATSSSKEQGSHKRGLKRSEGAINKKYIKELNKSRYKLKQTLQLNIEKGNTWDSFFSQEKENPKFIGFTHRSRRKFRYLYHHKYFIITEAAKAFEIICTEETREITYKGTPIDKFRANHANEQAIILNKKSEVAIINVNTGETLIYEFEWQPFTIAMGNDFWLVGTRETYDGPGELICFDYSGEQKWAITFKEKFSTMFGEITFTPYLLEVSSDSQNIFVSSMDCLYRLDTNGELKTRIATSELKKGDLKEKYRDLHKSLSRTPKTEDEAVQLMAEKMAAQISLSSDTIDINSSFAAFTHDPKTDVLYLLESEGRLSSWSPNGSLKWINTFKEKGRFLDFVDDKVIVSLETGETFWIDHEGVFQYGAKFPMGVSSISLIPNKDAYLLVCNDHRLYELYKGSGKFIKGSEGHPGMRLFQIKDQNVFFDGGESTQGYFWLAPPGEDWKHFEAKTFLEVDEQNIESGIAPEITPTEAFEMSSVLKSNSGYFGNRIIDLEREVIYVVEKPPQTDIRVHIEMTPAQQRKDLLRSFLICYDLNGNIVWEKQLYSDMWSLYASPDKSTIFTSVPSKDQVTYEPGHIHIFSNEGNILKKIKVDAHGFDLNFISDDTAIIKFPTEDRKFKRGIFKLSENGEWELTIPEHDVESALFPFGRGLHFFESKYFKLERIDKKKYNLISSQNQLELNPKAAVYQAVETPEGQLAFRTGTRSISFYNQKLKKATELKESKAIQTFAVGNNSTAIMTKEEIRCYDEEGTLKWRYSSLPKSNGILAWYPNRKLYLWILSNSNEKIVAAINENGHVVKSQLFKTAGYHRDILIYPNQDKFIAQTNSQIEIYRL